MQSIHTKKNTDDLWAAERRSHLKYFWRHKTRSRPAAWCFSGGGGVISQFIRGHILPKKMLVNFNII